MLDTGSKNKEKIVFLFYSIVFSILNVHILFLQHSKWFFDNALVEILVMPVVAAAVFYFVRLIYSFTKKCRNTAKVDFSKCRSYYFKTFLIQLVSWGIVFAAYWPGLFSEDISPQLMQGHGEVLTTHHPLVHNFYMQFFYYIVGGKLLNNYNWGIALSIIIQMLFASLALAYTHLFLFKVGLNKWIRYCLIFLSSVLPVFSLIFICTTKDAFFAAFVTLFFTLICEYKYDEQIFAEHRVKYLILLVAIIGMIMFRKNGVYPMIVLVMFVAAVSILQRNLLQNIRFILILVTGLFIGVILLAALKSVTGAWSGSINEMLSVPYQQISYVYLVHEDELSDDEKEKILEILPMAREYEPFRADPVKDYAVIHDKRSTLLKLWISLGKRYFGDYVTAFLRLNAGYLCVADTTYGEVYGKGNGKGVFMTYFVDGFGVEHKSLIPQLEWLYEKLYTYNYYIYVPILNILCSPAFYLWTMLLFFAVSIIKEEYDLIPETVFIATYTATLLLGPCAIVRYALAYIVCIPAYGALVLHKCNK